jgi:hypothetical protein
VGVCACRAQRRGHDQQATREQAEVGGAEQGGDVTFDAEGKVPAQVAEPGSQE